VRERILSGLHDGKIVPIATLERDNYMNSEYGKTWIPKLPIVDWMPLDGPAPAPAPEPAPPPVEQPRRRRVA
jgi:hypothetical protein